MNGKHREEIAEMAREIQAKMEKLGITGLSSIECERLVEDTRSVLTRLLFVLDLIEEEKSAK